MPPPHSSLTPSAPDRPARAVLTGMAVTGARLGPLQPQTEPGAFLSPPGAPDSPESSGPWPEAPQPSPERGPRGSGPEPRTEGTRAQASSRCQAAPRPEALSCPPPPRGGRHPTSAPTQPRASGQERLESLLSLGVPALARSHSPLLGVQTPGQSQPECFRFGSRQAAVCSRPARSLPLTPD